MKQSRLDALADGIFAIVMTILVFDIHVPDFTSPTEQDLLLSLYGIFAIVMTILVFDIHEQRFCYLNHLHQPE
jgi:uncharacterized membrane protein